VLSFGGLLFCFFFGEAKKKKSPRQALGSCEAKGFYGNINFFSLIKTAFKTKYFQTINEEKKGNKNKF